MAGKSKEESIAKVIEFPKEVKVYGKISHVYFEGSDKVTTLIMEENKQPSTSQSQPKKRSKEPVLIVPIEQENSEIRFVKVPLQKLTKSPKATRIGDNYGQKINLDGNVPYEETITEYITDVREIRKQEDNFSTDNDFNTCFVFKPFDRLNKDFLGRTGLPIADLFRFQEKPQLETNKIEKGRNDEYAIKTLVEMPELSLKKKPSVREAETNTEDNKRLMKFLISKKKRKRGL